MQRSTFLISSATASIAALCATTSALAAALDVAGSWTCTASGEGENGNGTGKFNLVLAQDNYKVTGSYYGDTAKLFGDLEGNTMLGTWHEKDGEGSFKFVFADDGNSFEGSWWIPGTSSTGSWSGTKDA